MTAAEMQVDGDTARLVGDLTFGTVTRLFDRMDALRKERNMPPVIDLSGVEQIDSSGLALLLEWQSQFTGRSENSPRLDIRHPPESLVKIARLCDAENYLSYPQAASRESPPQ